MEFLNNLFRDFVFTKTNLFDIPGFTSYVAKIHSYTDKKRYVIVMIEKDFNSNFAPEKAYIHQLNWISLQTRLLDDDPTINSQNVDHRFLDHRYIDDKISLQSVSTTDNGTFYQCILPIEILLLNDKKKNTKYQYPDKLLDIRQALNTFQCIIKLI